MSCWTSTTVRLDTGVGVAVGVGIGLGAGVDVNISGGVKPPACKETGFSQTVSADIMARATSSRDVTSPVASTIFQLPKLKLPSSLEAWVVQYPSSRRKKGEEVTSTAASRDRVIWSAQGRTSWNTNSRACSSVRLGLASGVAVASGVEVGAGPDHRPGSRSRLASRKKVAGPCNGGHRQ